MRPELQRLILNARTRLGEHLSSKEEAEENSRRQAIEEFQILLATKIGITTRLELLLEAEYSWEKTGPAVRFNIDGHTFTINHGDGQCELWEECGGGEQFHLCRLPVSDPNFEHRLLGAIGSALDPVRQ